MKVPDQRCTASRCTASGTRGLVPLPHVDEPSGNRGRRRHGWRHQVRAALVTLAAFEVAVRGRSAALARIELVWIHRKAHRAAGLAPLEAGFDEDFVEPLGF